MNLFQNLIFLILINLVVSNIWFQSVLIYSERQMTDRAYLTIIFKFRKKIFCQITKSKRDSNSDITHPESRGAK